MLDEYTARNNQAMQKLINEHGVNVRPLPDDVLAALKEATTEVMAQKSAEDAMFKKVYESYTAFYEGVRNYHKLSEQAYYNNR